MCYFCKNLKQEKWKYDPYFISKIKDSQLFQIFFCPLSLFLNILLKVGKWNCFARLLFGIGNVWTSYNFSDKVYIFALEFCPLFHFPIFFALKLYGEMKKRAKKRAKPETTRMPRLPISGCPQWKMKSEKWKGKSEQRKVKSEKRKMKSESEK